MNRLTPISPSWTRWLRATALACARDVSRLASSVGAALGVGAVACIACCAAPLLLGGAGLGSAALVSGTVAALIEPWIGAVTLALVLGAIAFFVVRQRAEAEASVVGASCTTAGSCAAPAAMTSGPADAGGCGCAPRASSTVYDSPAPEEGTPIVCTAGVDKPGAQEQLESYRAAFTHLASRERFDGGFRWTFRGGAALEQQLRELAEREHACCRFLAFHLVRDGRDVIWETRADAPAASVLEEFFELPARLAAGSEDLAAAYRRAGLSFAADPAGPPERR